MESSQHAEHVVFFPAPDGSPAFRRVPSLAEAALVVEHLRNVEGVHEVGVHRLSEVPLAFKPYYRVELPTEIAAPPAPEPELLPVPRPPDAVDGLDESLAQLLAREQRAEPLTDQLTPDTEPVEEHDQLAAAGATVLPAESHHRSRGLGFFSS